MFDNQFVYFNIVCFVVGCVLLLSNICCHYRGRNIVIIQEEEKFIVIIWEEETLIVITCEEEKYSLSLYGKKKYSWPLQRVATAP